MAGKIKLGEPKKANRFFESKLACMTGPTDLRRIKGSGEPVTVIDLRPASDYEQGHIPGAIHLPEEDWPNVKGLSKKMLNVFYCHSEACMSPVRAAYHFSKKGFRVMQMEGGFDSWKEYGYQIEESSKAQGPPEKRAA